jgi:hypothetical protein
MPESVKASGTDKTSKTKGNRIQGQRFSAVKSIGILVLSLIFLRYLSLLWKGKSQASLSTPSAFGMHQYKAILYHTNWANYGRNFQVKDIPIKGVTDIAYAFFDLRDAGNGDWEIVSGDTYPI